MNQDIGANINERIAAFTKDQREQLQHLFIHLVYVLENPGLKGFLFHTLPSAPASEIEPVLLHSINVELDEVEEMMCGFIAAKNAQHPDATPARSH